MSACARLELLAPRHLTRGSREPLWLAAIVMMALTGGVLRTPRGSSGSSAQAAGGCGAGGAAAAGAGGIGAAALKGAGSVAVKGATVGLAAREVGTLAVASRGASVAGEAAVATKGATATIGAEIGATHGGAAAIGDVSGGAGHGLADVVGGGGHAAGGAGASGGHAAQDAVAVGGRGAVPAPESLGPGPLSAMRAASAGGHAARAQAWRVGARALERQVPVARYPRLAARYPEAARLQREDPALFARFIEHHADFVVDLGSAICDSGGDDDCP